MSIGAKPWEGAGGAATVPDASETTKGKIRIATSAEATTGTDDLTAMTPLTVKERIDAALVGGVEYKGSYTGQSLVTAEQGDMYISSGNQTLGGISLTNGDHIIFNQNASDPVTGSMFDKIDNTDQVTSVNGQTGPVSLGIGDLNNVTISGGGADGDFVRYDSGDSRWENVTAASINLSDFNNDLSLSGNQITDVASQTGSTFTATANVIYVVGYTTGTQTITFPDASTSTDGDLIGLTSVTTTEFTVDLVSSDGTTNDLLNMSNQTKGGTNGAITLTLKQELILFACDGTRWRQLSRELADVAKTGAYADLSGTPTLATVATTGAYSDLSGTPTLGTAAALDVGTGASNVVQLDGSSRLPAVDGSQLTNLPSGVTDLDGLSDVTITSAAEGNLLQNNASGQFVNVAKSTIDVGDFNDDSTYQLRDAGLTSIAGLTTSANQMLYTTGSDAYDVTSITAAGRALLDDADAAAQRTTLQLGTAATQDVGTGANNVVQLDGSSRLPAVDGSQLTNLPSGASDLNGLSDVTISTPAGGNLLENNGSGQFVNVAKSTIDVGDFNDDSTYQLRDAGLTSIAGLTTSANQMLYTTGSDAYDVTSITAAGRAILDDADATAQRNTLGLGTAATQDVGTGANDVVQLDGSSRLPAVDGSQLTNLPSGGLSAVVDDTTPQLGGALDVNGNAITSASNGDVTINPDGTGDISVGADIIPDADATHTIGDEDNRFISLYSDVNGAIRFKAKNDHGSAITKGQVVYLKGVSGTVPTVGLARANSSSTMPAFGLALANANDQAEVQIITFGNLTDYNTTTYSLSANDTVFVSAATAGALTNSAPTGEANLIQNIGRVVRADASAGIIKVGGAGRSAATPNLDQDKVFLGNASNQAVSTALSAINLTSFNDDLGSTYQPLDTGLTSIAGLTTSANQMLYTTGSDAYDVTSITAAGRAILDDADAAAQRTTLGLVIGTDVLGEVADDSTPQLSGDLDTNGQDITTTSNANLGLKPHGTGFTELIGNTTGGNNPGSIRFNCEQNTHGVIVKSPLHGDYDSEGDYTLTLPTGLPDSDKVLQSTSAGVLSWVAQSGGGGGGSAPAVTSASPSSDYTISTTTGIEEVFLLTPSADINVNLPAAATAGTGYRYHIKNLSGSYNLTIDPNSTETIDGVATFSTQSQNESITCVSNGSNWFII